MKNPLRLLFLLLLLTQFAWAQTPPPTNLSGEPLKTWLRENWYDGKRIVLDYSTARGRMYNYVDNYNNKVTGVYSGYQEDKPFSETSTSTAMVHINCEHTVPQSWFDENVRMRSDIHHLFPTYEPWNSDRGSDPFAEIPDNQTTKWIRGTSAQSTIPTASIEEYSEDTNSQFEPREDHKGNLARAAFYFYTMHAGQSFDPGKGDISALADINTLYQWHLQDPVDAKERERNNRIENVQGNRNPYIDYPDLVAKAWGFAQVNCSPATQVSALSAVATSPSSLQLSWASGSGDSRLVVVRAGAAVDFVPAGSYSGISSDYSQAADQGNGQRIVYSGGGGSVTITGLAAATTYYLQVFEACAAGNNYNTASAPVASVTTPDYTCAGAPTVAGSLGAGNITQTGFVLTWANGSGDGRLVAVRKAAAVAFVPANGTAYAGANADYTLSAALSDGSKLVYNGAGSTVEVSGLEPESAYYVQVFERCSNGNQYATAGAPTYVVTTAASATGTPAESGTLIALQDFNGTASDGWQVTAGFSASSDNSGNPDGQRVRSGASLQTNATTNTLEFAAVDVTGKQGVYLELFNSAVSKTAGNGVEASDVLEVYVALNGDNFAATPDLALTGDQNDNNVRYGMDGTATLVTTAGTPLAKVFVKADGEAGDLEAGKAPSRLQVLVPEGATSVKLKLVVKTTSSNEVWNVDDVGLYAAAADCDAQPLEGFAGSDQTICLNSTAAIGVAAAAGYTYTWAPTVGLSDTNTANPTLVLTSPGVYTYTVTASNGTCTYQDEVTITAAALPATPVVSQQGNELTADVAGASYEWMLDGQVLAGAITQTITASAPGSYTVRVRSAAGCYSAYADALQVALQPTGVPKAANAVGISVVPNPSRGKVAVHTQQPLRHVEIAVQNMVGKQVYLQKVVLLQVQQDLDLSHLPNGLYLLHIRSGKLQAVQKLLIAK